MTQRTLYVTAITAVAACLLAAPASANHVQCGDTLTADTTLDNDIQCPPNSPYGLVIGADDVTLRFAGHKIQAGTGGGSTGITNSGGADQPVLRVDIRGGAAGGMIGGFDSGVIMAARDSAVRNVTISSLAYGVVLTGNGNSVHRNDIDVESSVGFEEAIGLGGDDAYVRGNVVTGGTILVGGDRARLMRNRVEGCGASSTGVYAFHYTTRAVLNRNTVSGCHNGIQARALPDSAGGAVIRLNQVSTGNTGVRISDPGAFVGRNTATGATNTGILIEQAGTTVQNNVANNNGNFGIYAAEGTIDGGGNMASGNGDGTTPQCVNVQCGSP